MQRGAGIVWPELFAAAETNSVASREVNIVDKNKNEAGSALAVKGLGKSFGAKRAVDGLDLAIPAGEFHALLGPNGAGKTTTLRMVAGLLRPDAGSGSLFEIGRA